MQEFDKKIIAITGGSQGIGKAVALHCAADGATVVIIARTKADLLQTREELTTLSDKPHTAIVGDVGEKKDGARIAQQIREVFGHLDGLVNCAGIYGPIGKIDDIDLDEFESAIRINLLGTVNMCHYLVPLMKNRHARIVNFSGGGAATPFPNYSAYATSKVAIVRLTENLSEELKDSDIQVNAIAPGFVATRLHQKTLQAGEKAGSSFFESTREQLEKGGVPPEKAARLCSFLLSGKSSGITGKFLSAAWDPWEEEQFLNELRTEKNFGTLRRIDKKNFFEHK